MSDAPSVIAIIPAAGTGSRIGLSRSKALLSAGALSIVERAVRALSTDPRILHAVIVGRATDLPELREMNFGTIPHSIVEGGETRQDSVRNGLEYIAAHLPLPSLVIVHDAARCLVSATLVSQCIDGGVLYGAVTAAIPAVDTLVECRENRMISGTLDRSRVWMVQTPQVFQYQLLLDAHRGGAPGATDDASLVRPLHPVYIIEGERGNVKITTREDYDALVGRFEG